MATNAFHETMSGAAMHGVIRWIVPTYAQLAEVPALPGDRGKVALVVDELSLHAVVDHDGMGAVWKRLDNEAVLLLSDSAPDKVSADQEEAAGSAGEAARADHVHRLASLVRWEVSSLADIGPDAGDKGSIARVEVDGNVSYYILARDTEPPLWMRIDNEEIAPQELITATGWTNGTAGWSQVTSTPDEGDVALVDGRISIAARQAQYAAPVWNEIAYAADVGGINTRLETTEVPPSVGASSAAGTSIYVAKANHTHQGKRWIWTWANSAAKAAQVVNATQVGLIGWQTDIQREYVLLSAWPVRWGELKDTTLSAERGYFAQHSSAALATTGLVGLFFPSGTTAARSLPSAALTRSAQLPRFSLKCASTAQSMGVARTQGSTSNLVAQTGYRARFLWVLGAVSTTMRWLFGIGQFMNFSSGNQSPSVMFTSAGGFGIALGADVGDANVNLWYGGSALVANKINLGPGFSARTLDLGLLLEIYTRDGTSFSWLARNIDTTEEASGTIATATHLPAPGSPSMWGAYVTNGTDAVEVALDISEVTIGNVLR